MSRLRSQWLGLFLILLPLPTTFLILPEIGGRHALELQPSRTMQAARLNGTEVFNVDDKLLSLDRKITITQRSLELIQVLMVGNYPTYTSSTSSPSDLAVLRAF